MTTAPLKNVQVIELAGLAPGPFTGMILADYGAQVIRIDRANVSQTSDVLARGKRSIALNLKSKLGIPILERLLSTADVLIDPYRPGVLESLGIIPSNLLVKYPKLIIARLTGYGQTGPYAQKAGHDLNYIALAGVLSLFGPKDGPPVFPGNLIADFAGGGLFCALGILMALFQRFQTGVGQILDASMVDASLYLSSFILKMKSTPIWNKGRGENVLDGAAPFYQVYKTKDDKYFSVGAIEPEFYKNFIKGLISADPNNKDTLLSFPQMDVNNWPQLSLIFAHEISKRDLKEWESIFKDLDACVAPVLDLLEARNHSHHQFRNTYMSKTDIQPPLRMKSLTPTSISLKQPKVGQHSLEILKEYGFNEDQIQGLLNSGIVSSLPESKL